jgi:prepilin-type N-terminal cleavage/methylation domain-containing protein
MRLVNANTKKTAASIKMSKRQGGFTLIEVLIALTIFAVGLLAIAAMQTSAIQMNRTAGNLTELSSLGMDRLEKLIALPYTSNQLNPTNSPFTDLNPPAGYSVTWTVANGAAPNTIFIKLTVRHGNSNPLQLTCIRAQSL